MKSPQYETKYGEAASEEFQALRKRILSKPRVCNSDDGEDVMKKGLCIPSESDYEEVRVYGQNWESGFVMAWMLQIVYSELLGVPSTIESGTGDANINFYDAMNRMEYGTGNDVDVIENAYNAEGGDCSVYRDREEYMPCANVVVEVWSPETWSPVIESGAGEAAKCELKTVGTFSYRFLSCVSHYFASVIVSDWCHWQC